MKYYFSGILIITAIMTGCATADFKVLDSLAEGMKRHEAQQIISEHGFEREFEMERPLNGWKDERIGWVALDWRAGLLEKELNKEVKFAEYYPVGHGMFGFGQLFLFYDENNVLLRFYRIQIN